MVHARRECVAETVVHAATVLLVIKTHRLMYVGYLCPPTMIIDHDA